MHFRFSRIPGPHPLNTSSDTPVTEKTNIPYKIFFKCLLVVFTIPTDKRWFIICNLRRQRRQNREIRTPRKASSFRRNATNAYWVVSQWKIVWISTPLSSLQVLESTAQSTEVLGILKFHINDGPWSYTVSFQVKDPFKFLTWSLLVAVQYSMASQT